MRKDPKAQIIRKIDWGNYHLLSLESPAIASQVQPGQFIMIRVTSSLYPLLRRPFSIHFSDGKKIEIFFQETGLGTSLLSQKRGKDFLDILGPLGKGFPLHPSLKGKETAVIGGGRGIAPLYFLALKLRELRAAVRVFYGGKTPSDLPLRERFDTSGLKLFCSTDNGSFGYHGFVSDFFVSELNKFVPDRIFACGPEPMLEKLARIALDRNIPASFSLESVMGCGIGACWSCVKKIKKDGKEEWRKICEDGPVFSAEEVIWQSEEK